MFLSDCKQIHHQNKLRFFQILKSTHFWNFLHNSLFELILLWNTRIFHFLLKQLKQEFRICSQHIEFNFQFYD